MKWQLTGSGVHPKVYTGGVRKVANNLATSNKGNYVELIVQLQKQVSWTVDDKDIEKVRKPVWQPVNHVVLRSEGAKCDTMIDKKGVLLRDKQADNPAKKPKEFTISETDDVVYGKSMSQAHHQFLMGYVADSKGNESCSQFKRGIQWSWV